jgi:predicted anti-sigma-YlaC factor YlaD
MTAHLERDWLERYARGELDQARSFSVEAHLPACAACRAQVAGLVDPRRMARGWDAVDLAIDLPRRTPVERLLVRAGVREDTARLLATTPALRLSWLAAVTLVLLIGVVAAALRGERGLMLFLLVAPLLPVAGVALTYGPHVDPAHELSVGAPLSGLRLLLLRAVAVTATTTVAAAVAALWLPGLHWTAAAWLVPSLGLTLAALALTSVTGQAPACALVGAVWTCAVIAAWQSSGDPLLAFGSAGQLASLAAAAAGATTLLLRRDTYEIGRPE